MSTVVELEQAIIDCYKSDGVVGLLSVCSLPTRPTEKFDPAASYIQKIKNLNHMQDLYDQIGQLFNKVHYYFLWCCEDRHMQTVRPQALSWAWWNNNQVMLWNLLVIYFRLKTNIGLSRSASWLLGFLHDKNDQINCGETRIRSPAELETIKQLLC